MSCKYIMQTKYLCVLIHIWIKRFVPWNRFKPASQIFYWPFQGVTSLWIFYVFSLLCLLCLCACHFICALWSPPGKGLTSWLLFVVFYYEFVSFPLVSWVRFGTWLYRFLIFAPLLTWFSRAHRSMWNYKSLWWPARNRTSDKLNLRTVMLIMNA